MTKDEKEKLVAILEIVAAVGHAYLRLGKTANDELIWRTINTSKTGEGGSKALIDTESNTFVGGSIPPEMKNKKVRSGKAWEKAKEQAQAENKAKKNAKAEPNGGASTELIDAYSNGGASQNTKRKTTYETATELGNQFLSSSNPYSKANVDALNEKFGKRSDLVDVSRSLESKDSPELSKLVDKAGVASAIYVSQVLGNGGNAEAKKKAIEKIKAHAKARVQALQAKAHEYGEANTVLLKSKVIRGVGDMNVAHNAMKIIDGLPEAVRLNALATIEAVGFEHGFRDQGSHSSDTGLRQGDQYIFINDEQLNSPLAGEVVVHEVMHALDNHLSGGSATTFSDVIGLKASVDEELLKFADSKGIKSFSEALFDVLAKNNGKSIDAFSLCQEVMEQIAPGYSDPLFYAYLGADVFAKAASGSLSQSEASLLDREMRLVFAINHLIEYECGGTALARALNDYAGSYIGAHSGATHLSTQNVLNGTGHQPKYWGARGSRSKDMSQSRELFAQLGVSLSSCLEKFETLFPKTANELKVAISGGDVGESK